MIGGLFILILAVTMLDFSKFFLSEGSQDLIYVTEEKAKVKRKKFSEFVQEKSLELKEERAIETKDTNFKELNSNQNMESDEIKRLAEESLEEIYNGK